MATYTITLQSPDGTENTFDCDEDNYILEQAEDGIRDCLLSRGLGDVYKRQILLKNERSDICICYEG